MNSSERFDLIIVGGGALGLAAAYSARLRNLRVLVLEQHEFHHGYTASGGGSRQYRLQYNDRNISRLVMESAPYWQELQRQTSDELQKRVGCLWFGDPGAVGVEGTIATVLGNMRELGIPYEELGSADVMRRFDFYNIDPGWVGFFQPDGASTNVRATLTVLHRLAEESDRVSFRPGHRVVGMSSDPDGVRVETAGGGVFHADKLILVPGPEINEVMKLLGIRFETVIWEMASAYFRAVKPQTAYPTWINFVDNSGPDPGLYYGFPETSWDSPGLVKVAAAYPSKILSSLGERSATLDPRILAQISGWVRSHMSFLDPMPLDPSTCVCALFTDPVNPGALKHEFVLDFAPPAVPHGNNIVICATGWVFKLAPLLGKICVDLAIDGRTQHDISSVAISEDMWSITADKRGLADQSGRALSSGPDCRLAAMGAMPPLFAE
jgi:glycine/D-amino acid oxidase-like deaminating enzyme